MPNLASRTARSSVKLIRQSLADLRAASADLSNDANIQEVTRSADVLSGAIKRLERYVKDGPMENDPPAPNSGRPRIDIVRVARNLAAIKKGDVCPKCAFLRP